MYINKEAPKLYPKYWAAFKEYLSEHNSVFQVTRKPPGRYVTFEKLFAIKDFDLLALTSVRDQNIRVQLRTKGQGRHHFLCLEKDKDQIKRDIDPKSNEKTEWQDNPKECWISLYQFDADPRDSKDWKRQHRWLCCKLQHFYEIFKPRIDALSGRK